LQQNSFYQESVILLFWLCDRTSFEKSEKMATVLLEARPYRPFKSSEEYLYAMREDLAEWLSTLYPELLINVDNFMDRLDTGIALCKVIFLL
jgi:hypothetical protein